MDKIRDVERFFLEELDSFYIKEEVKSFVLLLLAHLRDYERKDIIINENELLTGEEIFYLKNALLRLKKSEPVQYIIGYTEFYELKIFTDKRALIPRPETEELVSLILSENQNVGSILDIGTGSGCIPISLKKNLPNAKVAAWDISEDALALANKNADYNNVDIKFEKVDVLSVEAANDKFDVIVSNPPYVTPADKELMQKNVLDYEPHLALFVKMENPLIFYEKIASLGSKMLNNNGNLYFEINENYGDETLQLLRDIGYTSLKVIKDLSGRNRMVRATWMY